MQPIEIPLDPIVRGDTVPFSFVFNRAGVPIDMRGMTIIIMFKFAALQADNKAPLVKSVTAPVDSVSASNGLVYTTLETSDTLKLKGGVTYSMSIRLIEPNFPEPRESTLLFSNVLVEDK